MMRLLALLLCLLLLPAPAWAQPSNGASLQARIDAARPGERLEVPYAHYDGALLISRPLHLVGMPGPGGERPVIDGRGVGTVVTIQAPGTTVEGFQIQGSGNAIDREDGGIVVDRAADVTILNNRLEDVLYGVRAIEADRLRLLDNEISGKALHIARRGDGIRLWQSEDCLVEGNTISKVRDAIFWFSDGTTVRNNRFVDSRYGIHMMYTDWMVVERNELSRNSVGAYLMYSSHVQIGGNTFRGNRGPSGYGLALKDMDWVEVVDNYFEDNRVGIYFDNSPSRVDIAQSIERNVLAFNDVGVLMMPAVRNNRLRDNTFLDNLEQVGLKGSGSNPGESLGANGWEGNYWSDYAGYDEAGDGTGDLPYRSESLFESLADQYPPLALLHFSPVEQAIDLAARAFPIIKPRPKLTDPSPRIEPRLPLTAPAPVPSERGLGWLAAGLLGGVVLALWGGRPATGPERVPEGAEGRTEAEIPVQPARSGDAAAPMIQVGHLTKRYPQPGRAWWSDATVTAVDDLSFDVAAGAAVALWGANGAGKTTVLKCLLGLLRCEGELRLDGMDLRRDGRRARRHFGYVPQELAFHADLSVAESCRFYARLKGVGKGRIPIVLAQVGLAGQERKSVGALSGGMKQRLALALALLADPPVLLLDEPTSNLDAATRLDLLALLASLRAGGKTLLFTSHHVDEVEHLADQVLILHEGRIEAQGTPEALMARLDPRRTRAESRLIDAAAATSRNGGGPRVGPPENERDVYKPAESGEEE